MTTSLRQQIIGLRRRIANTDLRFIPHRPLIRLLTNDAISAALHRTNLSELHRLQIPSIAQRITSGGRKVFAILVFLKDEEAMIVQFFKHDQLVPTPLDSRLPFSQEELTNIVPDIASEFFERQWEFCAPIFSKGVLHRELHDSIHLPFVSEKSYGAGGFGDVYWFKLDKEQQTFAFTDPEDESSLQSLLPRHIFINLS